MPNVLSQRDLVSKPDNMDELYYTRSHNSRETFVRTSRNSRETSVRVSHNSRKVFVRVSHDVHVNVAQFYFLRIKSRNVLFM